MGRHNSNTVAYFPHYIGDGKKIFSIEKKYGNDGYATWFKILEKLATTENHFLDLNDDGELFYLSAKCNIDEDRLTAIISDLTKLNVFDKSLWESKVVYSHSFIDSIADAYKRRNQKCMQFEQLCKHLSDLGIHKYTSKCKKVGKSTQSRVEEKKVEEIYKEFDGLSITFEEIETLKNEGYSAAYIDDTLSQIQNYKGNNKYKSLIATVRNWMKRNNSNKPASLIEPEQEDLDFQDQFYKRQRRQA